MAVATNGTANGKTVVEGIVARTHNTGIKLKGHEGWLNWSKFAKNPWMPDEGDQVRAILDGSGFIRALEPIAAEPPAPITTTPEMTDAPAETTTPPDRERVITRQWAVNAAISYLASGGKRIDDIDAVLTVAAKLEMWALRPA